ncbi:hypothetical protein YSY43_39000 [Paenibacillus sp. YSY-4.3]
MIVWKGWGIFIIVIPAMIFYFVDLLVSPLGLDSLDKRLPLAFVCIVSGIILWYVGKAFNADSGRVLVDEETGERYKMAHGHSLFSIPMHYWGPIGLVAGFILIVATIVSYFSLD